jgi:hypothetical protein
MHMGACGAQAVLEIQVKCTLGPCGV